MSTVPPAGEPLERPYAPEHQPSPSNGTGVAALVVGIVSLFLWWIPFLGLVVAIVAVVLGIVTIRKASRGEATNKGMGITGVVTGGLALLGAVFITVLAIGLFNSDEFQTFAECVEQAQTAEERADCQMQFEEDFNQ